MGVIIYSFNLNISPKMSYGVLEWYCYVTELHAYDFVLKDFVIKKWHYLCWTLYIDYFEQWALEKQQIQEKAFFELPLSA